MGTRNEGREWVRLQCRKTLGGVPTGDWVHQRCVWHPQSTEVGHGCGEATGSAAHQRLGRSPGEEQRRTDQSPDGAEVMEFKVKGGLREDWLRPIRPGDWVDSRRRGLRHRKTMCSSV